MQTSRKTPLFSFRCWYCHPHMWAGSKADADGQFCCDNIPLHLPCLNFHSYNLLLIYHEKNMHSILFSSCSTQLSLWLSLLESSSHAKAPLSHAVPITTQVELFPTIASLSSDFFFPFPRILISIQSHDKISTFSLVKWFYSFNSCL